MSLDVVLPNTPEATQAEGLDFPLTTEVD